MTSTHPLPRNQPGQSLAQFKSDVEAAVSACLPSWHKPYERVMVLLTCWDNSPESEEELDTLLEVLRGLYRYETIKFLIPTGKDAYRDKKATLALNTKILELLGALGPNDLFIFYYGGHSLHEYDKTRFAHSERPCIAQSNAFVRRNFSDTIDLSQTQEVTTVNLSMVIQSTVKSVAISDVLYIIDACYASSVAIMGTKELLAAAAIDRFAPGAGTEGSFTRALVEHLENLGGTTTTVSQIHAALIRSFYKNELTTTPVHIELSNERRAKGSIILAPLEPSGSPPPSHSPRSKRETNTTTRPTVTSGSLDPRVLLAIHLSANRTPLDAKQWITWLTSNLPSDIDSINIEPVGLFKTSSSILLLTIPLDVWSALRGDPDYEFVSIVTSGNLMRDESGVAARDLSRLSISGLGKENQRGGNILSEPHSERPGSSGKFQSFR